MTADKTLIFALNRLLRRCVPAEGGCIVWEGCVNSRGYGVISLDGARVLTHRLSYEAHIGPIPDGLQIDHLCRNKRCVNPAHLEPVTGLENQRRAAASKTHCPRNHPLAGSNLILKKRPNGSFIRNCRTCNNAQQRARAFFRNNLDRPATRAEVAEWIDSEFASARGGVA